MTETMVPMEEEAPTSAERADEYPITKHAASAVFGIAAIAFSILFMHDLLFGSGTGG